MHIPGFGWLLMGHERKDWAASWSLRANEVLREVATLHRKAHPTEDAMIVTFPGALWFQLMALAQGNVPERPTQKDEAPAP